MGDKFFTEHKSTQTKALKYFIKKTILCVKISYACTGVKPVWLVCFFRDNPKTTTALSDSATLPRHKALSPQMNCMGAKAFHSTPPQEYH